MRWSERFRRLLSAGDGQHYPPRRTFHHLLVSHVPRGPGGVSPFFCLRKEKPVKHSRIDTCEPGQRSVSPIDASASRSIAPDQELLHRFWPGRALWSQEAVHLDEWMPELEHTVTGADAHDFVPESIQLPVSHADLCPRFAFLVASCGCEALVDDQFSPVTCTSWDHRTLFQSPQVF